MAASKMSPSADRTIRILNHLAEHAEQAFTFSQLRRDLGMSSGTLHALLATLVKASYVRRNPDALTYSLGPALLALGAAARSGYRLVDDLVPEMERMSAELGLTCHASVAQNDEMVVIARSGPVEPFGRRVRVGERYPLTPPFGTAFVAWSDPASVDDYLARSDPPLRPDDRERCRGALERVRQRGYAVSLNPSTRHGSASSSTGPTTGSGANSASSSPSWPMRYTSSPTCRPSRATTGVHNRTGVRPGRLGAGPARLANSTRPIAAEAIAPLAARFPRRR